VTMESDLAEAPGRLVRYAAWGAYLSALATALGAVFFLVGFVFLRLAVFGPLSDLTAILVAGGLAPVMWVLYLTHRADAPVASLAALGSGLTGFTLIAAGSIAHILRELGAPAPAPDLALGVQYVGTGLAGIWLLLVGALALLGKTFQWWIGWAAVAAGAGYLAIGLGIPLAGEDHPVVSVGGAVVVVGFVLWAVGQGRRLSSLGHLHV
jgi:hypothetical protein